MALDELQTPCLVVDLDRLERNLRSWQDAVTAHGVRFRPHIKTHKTLEIARMQLAAGAAGITTAKVSEAELYVDAGFDDVVVAYPVVAEQACARLAAAGRAGAHRGERREPGGCPSGCRARRWPRAPSWASSSTSTPASAAAACRPATPRRSTRWPIGCASCRGCACAASPATGASATRAATATRPRPAARRARRWWRPRGGWAWTRRRPAARPPAARLRRCRG